MPCKAIATVICTACFAVGLITFTIDGNAAELGSKIGVPEILASLNTSNYQTLSADKLTQVIGTFNLTGIWTANDGGTYYIRQIGDKLYWYGEGAFANVAFGTIDYTQAKMEWADVPKTVYSGYGTLSLLINNDNSMYVVSKTGGFYGSTFTRR